MALRGQAAGRASAKARREKAGLGEGDKTPPQEPSTGFEAVKPLALCYEMIATVDGRTMNPQQYAALVRAADNLLPLGDDTPKTDLQRAAHAFLLAELTGKAPADLPPYGVGGIPLGQDTVGGPACCETGACEPPAATPPETHEGGQA